MKQLNPSNLIWNKQNLFCLTILLCLRLVSFGQPPINLNDNEGYNRFSYSSLNNSKYLDSSSDYYSVYHYTPKISDQGKLATCGTWATIYYGLTAYDAIQQSISDKNYINDCLAFSPLFSFEDAGGDCDNGLLLSEVMENFIARGACRFSEYTDSDPCDGHIEESVKTVASIYPRSRKMISKVFEESACPAAKTDSVIYQLKHLNPVVVAFEARFDFNDKRIINRKPHIWTPRRDSVLGHAMLVVEYDTKKKLFKLANSYGSQFGEQGYCYITADSFGSFAKYAYAFQTNNGKGGVQSIQTAPLSGHWEMLSIDTDSDQQDNLRPVEVAFDEDKNYYILNANNNRPASFITEIGIPRGRCVYFFSYIPSNNFIELDTLIEYPNQDYKLSLPLNEDEWYTYTGDVDDYIIVLYSYTAIPGVKEKINLVDQIDGDLQTKLEFAFGTNFFIKDEAISFSPQSLKFSTNQIIKRGTAVPLVLNLKKQ